MDGAAKWFLVETVNGKCAWVKKMERDEIIEFVQHNLVFLSDSLVIL